MHLASIMALSSDIGNTSFVQLIVEKFASIGLKWAVILAAATALALIIELGESL